MQVISSDNTVDCVTVTSEPQDNSQAIYFLPEDKYQVDFGHSEICFFFLLLSLLLLLLLWLSLGLVKSIRDSSHFQRAARMCNHPEKCEINSYSKSRAHTEKHSH